MILQIDSGPHPHPQCGEERGESFGEKIYWPTLFYPPNDLGPRRVGREYEILGGDSVETRIALMGRLRPGWIKW